MIATFALSILMVIAYLTGKQKPAAGNLLEAQSHVAMLKAGLHASILIYCTRCAGGTCGGRAAAAAAAAAKLAGGGQQPRGPSNVHGNGSDDGGQQQHQQLRGGRGGVGGGADVQPAAGATRVQRRGAGGGARRRRQRRGGGDDLGGCLRGRAGRGGRAGVHARKRRVYWARHLRERQHACYVPPNIPPPFPFLSPPRPRELQPVDITLKPGASRVVSLRVVATSPGRLLIHGVRWLLSGVAHGTATFTASRAGALKRGRSTGGVRARYASPSAANGTCFLLLIVGRVLVGQLASCIDRRQAAWDLFPELRGFFGGVDRLR